MIQPVVNPVVKTVWQPAVSCIQPVVKCQTGCTTRFDNQTNQLNEQWLYRVNGVLENTIRFFKLGIALCTVLRTQQWMESHRNPIAC